MYPCIRSDTEHESSRRMKTEFLVQLDGANTVGEEKILIVGATNRPQVKTILYPVSFTNPVFCILY